MDLRFQAATKALEYVQDGMILGLGTGLTATYFVDLLGERLQRGELHGIRGVPTSRVTEAHAQAQGIPLTTLSELERSRDQAGRAPDGLLLDLAVDSADEVDPDLNLIKGLGRALLREKIIEMHARRFLIVVDESKLVTRLGRGPLPVEIVSFEAEVQVRWLRRLGCRAELWLEPDGSPVTTDNGNYLARCWFPTGIPDSYALARRLSDRPGIVEHGLFLDMATEAIAATAAGIRIMKR